MQFIDNELQEHIEVAIKTKKLLPEIKEAAYLIVSSLQNGKKILLFGNGGSAADAQHIAAELTGRYKSERQALPAIALTTDTSTLTAISNDYGYESVFARQIEAFADNGDIAIAISTSGNSKNVTNALKLAKKKDCICIGLSGNNGGEMNELCDINLIVQSSNTPRIQEMHIFIGHTICHIIDEIISVS
jgi:D-sedoheptulose 7-phosphate isomerase